MLMLVKEAVTTHNIIHLHKIFSCAKFFFRAYIKILRFSLCPLLDTWLVNRRKLNLWEILGRSVSFECLKGRPVRNFLVGSSDRRRGNGFKFMES